MADWLMDYPSGKDGFFTPAEFETLREETLNQIEKDFRLQGIDLTFENKVIDYPQLVAIVGQKLEQEGLINSLALRPLLYQLDISEDYVQQEITGKPKESALLSDAIIKRCFAKVIYRKKFR